MIKIHARGSYFSKSVLEINDNQLAFWDPQKAMIHHESVGFAADHLMEIAS